MKWSTSRWMIFVILFVVLLVFTGYFTAKSYLIFDKIVENISRQEMSESSIFLAKLLTNSRKGDTEITARLALEADTIRVRHRRATSALVTRTWLRFMSASFGAILISIGAFFVLGQVSAKTSTIDGSWEKAKISLVISSPGILLAVLGVILIITPIIAKQSISANDTASFFAKISLASNKSNTDEMNKLARNRAEAYCKKYPNKTGC